MSLEKTIIEYFINHANLFESIGNYILVLGSFSESIPFFGFLIPGQTFLILGGFASKLLEINLFNMIIYGAVGAILGDVTGFLVGKKYGEKLLEKYAEKIFITKEHISETKELIKTHIFKAICFGKFHPVTRTLTPFISGVSKIKFFKFFIISVFSSSVWASVFIFLGFLFGSSFISIGSSIGKFILVASIITIIVIGLCIYAKKRKVTITTKETVLVILSLVSVYTFATIAESTYQKLTFFKLDEWVSLKTQLFHSESLTHFFSFISFFGEKYFIFAISFLLGILFILRSKIKELIVLWSAVFISALSVFILKNAFNNPRPEGGMFLEDGYSFPSGHATLSTTFFLTLALLFFQKIQNCFVKKIFFIISVFLPTGVVLSRLYFRVHWLSDVVAGIALAVFISISVYLLFDLMVWIYYKLKNKEIRLPNI